MNFEFPTSSAKGVVSVTSGQIAVAIAAVSLSAFISGFILTTYTHDSQDGRIYPLQMNYPTPMHWRWRHQLLLSIVLACLPPSQVIYQSHFGHNFNFVASNNFSVGDSSSWTFLAPWYLLLFATTFIAAMQHSGSIVTVRNTMGGMLLDLSMALGHTLRSRNLRYVWRIRLLVLCQVAFFVGGLTGSLVLQSSFYSSAIMYPFILFAAVWIQGFALLVMRYSNYAKYSTPKRDLAASYVDVARGNAGQFNAVQAMFVAQPVEMQPSGSHPNLEMAPMARVE
jgi:hypothetical protein